MSVAMTVGYVLLGGLAGAGIAVALMSVGAAIGVRSGKGEA